MASKPGTKHRRSHAQFPDCIIACKCDKIRRLTGGYFCDTIAGSPDRRPQVLKKPASKSRNHPRGGGCRNGRPGFSPGKLLARCRKAVDETAWPTPTTSCATPSPPPIAKLRNRSAAAGSAGAFTRAARFWRRVCVWIASRPVRVAGLRASTGIRYSFFRSARRGYTGRPLSPESHYSRFLQA